MPKRVQMTRHQPWRAANPGAVIVARPSKWGNPFRVNQKAKQSPAVVVEMYRRYVESDPFFVDVVRANLAGRDLACWCRLDEPCHGDVLLELANQESSNG